ncbi:alpha/beta hydrolase [Novosphingobium soli]|uniref:Alpha/beta hydrolase n=1 Tax=Novosphingobium soli TaxID=574956 RepID=A0ABV6CUJ9_9SPHN
MRRVLGAALMLSLLAASPVAAQQAPTSIDYGTDAAQTLDLWRPDAKAAVPLVLFVHGGGWKRGSKDNATGPNKAPHYTQEGYAFASVNYRLVPEASVEQQAQDIADALAALIARADSLGIARGKVVLMGHSAGAQLVALVGTDPRYLHKAGLSYADIRGVIPIDGAAYDVPTQVTDGPPIMQKTYAQAFGTDPARQRALSPTLQAAAPNAPAFLLLHVQRQDGVRQAQGLEAALRRAGTPVERQGFAGQGLRGHMAINRELGDPAYPATAAVDAWLAKVLR